MEHLIFNKTCVCDSPISAKDVIVRTGSSQFNDKEPFISFVNALLHANYKKFSGLGEAERNEQSRKLRETIIKRVKNGEKFKLKISSFLQTIQEVLTKLYEYLNSNDLTNLKCDSNKKFCARLLNNGEHGKIEIFTILSEIISISNFRKIFRIVETKWTSHCINDYTKLLQKETIRFFMYQDIFEEIEKEKADFFVKNIINLINVLCQISFEKVCKDDKNFISNDVMTDKIDILSEYLENNIVLIDSENRQPFLPGTIKELSSSHKTVILLSFDFKHFEIVGKLLPDKRIQRTFLTNDDIVQNIMFILSENTKKKIENDVEKDKEKEDETKKEDEETFDANDIKENLHYNSDEEEMINILGE